MPLQILPNGSVTKAALFKIEPLQTNEGGAVTQGFFREIDHENVQEIQARPRPALSRPIQSLVAGGRSLVELP
jgi:hypothetical protein